MKNENLHPALKMLVKFTTGLFTAVIYVALMGYTAQWALANISPPAIPGATDFMRQFVLVALIESLSTIGMIAWLLFFRYKAENMVQRVVTLMLAMLSAVFDVTTTLAGVFNSAESYFSLHAADFVLYIISAELLLFVVYKFSTNWFLASFDRNTFSSRSPISDIGATRGGKQQQAKPKHKPKNKPKPRQPEQPPRQRQPRTQPATAQSSVPAGRQGGGGE